MPTRTGTYDILCSQYCGVGHSAMLADLVVVTPEQYDAWYAGASSALPGEQEAAGAPGQSALAGDLAGNDRGRPLAAGGRDYRVLGPAAAGIRAPACDGRANSSDLARRLRTADAGARPGSPPTECSSVRQRRRNSSAGRWTRSGAGRKPAPARCSRRRSFPVRWTRTSAARETGCAA